MLISCPECRAVYNISADYIPESGKKFKCAECGYIWMVYPSDDTSVEPETETAPEPTEIVTATEESNTIDENIVAPDVSDDIDVMFKRLSHNTKNLFSSGDTVESMTWSEKIRHYVLNNFSIYMLTAFLLLTAVVLGARLIWDYRYDVVAKVPMMEQLYTRLGAESIYRGKDLVIEDVLVKNISQNQKPYLEVSGRLYNEGTRTVSVLPVKASVIDADNKVEDEVTEILSEHKLEPKFGTLFRILLNPPSASARKVKITLDDINR